MKTIWRLGNIFSKSLSSFREGKRLEQSLHGYVQKTATIGQRLANYRILSSNRQGEYSEACGYCALRGNFGKHNKIMLHKVTPL